jgi:predicted PolB exonuclease-like 3'-5' exonuclease
MTNNKQQTAVDKAKELVSKMEKDFQYFASRQIAIQHALIAVDEIYKLNLKTGAYLDSDSDKINYYSYWEEVKQEIEKL